MRTLRLREAKRAGSNAGRWVAVALTGLCLASGYGGSASFTVTGVIHFQGRGDIYVDLVTSEGFRDPFPRKPYLLVLKIGARELERQWVPFRFEQVPEGVYALRSFQDENGNGVMDKRLLGPPKEPWGLYRRSRPKMRGPTYQEVAFLVSEDVTGVRITLKE